mmetsp:Transcript_2903/g.6841  ORF Transcript_2903/g.6841 Transcript_2903/m.6841 type:complete len:123 (-) Transcript_2903:93-461(-)
MGQELCWMRSLRSSGERENWSKSLLLTPWLATSVFQNMSRQGSEEFVQDKLGKFVLETRKSGTGIAELEPVIGVVGRRSTTETTVVFFLNPGIKKNSWCRTRSNVWYYVLLFEEQKKASSSS